MWTDARAEGEVDAAEAKPEARAFDAGRSPAVRKDARAEGEVDAAGAEEAVADPQASKAVRCPDVPERVWGEAHALQTLHLFSGPDDRTDGMAAFLQTVGIGMYCVDVVNKCAWGMDIGDDVVWCKLKAVIRAGYYHFLFAGPPCRTFSLARQVRPGPPPLRDRQYPYGFPRSQARKRGLKPTDFDKIRLDNLLAARTAEACSIMRDLGRGFAVEQPWPWGERGADAPSMFELDQFADLQRQGAKTVVFDQCMYGASSPKPTQILYHFARFDGLAARCHHPAGSHAPTVGVKTKAGDFATKALSAYPSQLNKAIADIISESLVDAC